MVIGFARTPEPAAAFSVDEPARSKRRLRQRGPACDQVAPRGAGDLARLGRKRWMAVGQLRPSGRCTWWAVRRPAAPPPVLSFWMPEGRLCS